MIRPEDLLAQADTWDALVVSAFVRISSVEQPLWYFVREKLEVEQALANGGRPASCRRNYCSPRTPALVDP